MGMGKESREKFPLQSVIGVEKQLGFMNRVIPIDHSHHSGKD